MCHKVLRNKLATNSLAIKLKSFGGKFIQRDQDKTYTRFPYQIVKNYTIILVRRVYQKLFQNNNKAQVKLSVSYDTFFINNKL